MPRTKPHTLITRKKISKGLKRHGMKGTRFYKIWERAKYRCSSSKNKYYGGRGIKFGWDKFQDFMQDMYSSYLDHKKRFGVEDTTLDRIDNNGNYYKENCRWTTKRGQQLNTRANVVIEVKGKKMTIIEWDEELRINHQTISARIGYGFTPEQAVLLPKHARHKSKEAIDKVDK